MDLEIIRSPVTVGLFRNFFGPEVNARILDELISHGSLFQRGGISQDNVLIDEIRTNSVLFFDRLYEGRRHGSALLTALDGMIASRAFHFHCFPLGYPMCLVDETTWTSTQASRFGEDQKYDWHHDKNAQRRITLVYYVFKEPRRFRGGELCLSDGVAIRGSLVEQKPEPGIVSIPPENDLAVVFASTLAHRVLPTSSGPAFEDGRLSATCWIGFR